MFNVTQQFMGRVKQNPAFVNSYQLSEDIELQHNGEVPSSSSSSAHNTSSIGIEVTQEEQCSESGDDFEYDKGHFIVVVGSCIGLMPGWGIMSALGIFQAYLCQHQLSNVDASTVSWIFSIEVFFTMGSAIFIGPAFDRYGAKPLMAIGIILTIGGLIATSFCNKTWEFILSFGFMVGLGSGFVTTPCVSVVNQYYIKKVGLMQGISELGGSIGGVVIPLVLRQMFERSDWGWAIRVLALFSLVCLLISFLCIHDRSKELNRGKPQEPLWKLIARNFDPKQLKDTKFTLLIVSLVLYEFALMMVLNYLPSFAIAEGVSESASFLMVMTIGIGGLFGHVLPSLYSDYFGRCNMLVITSIFMTICTFALWLPAQYFPHKILGLYFFIVIFGFLMASAYSLAPALIGELSKVEEAGKRIGIVYGFNAMFDLASLPIGGKILGRGDMAGYTNLIVVSGAICATSSLSICLLRYKISPKILKAA